MGAARRAPGVSLVCGWIIVGLVGRVDWGQVVEALAELAWWQAPVLLLVLVVRQVLNASPLVVFIDGLGWRRAVQNDQAATLMSTIAPPPSDMVPRLAMLNSWGFPASQAVAGTYMNIVTFYSTRFLVPSLGLALLLATPSAPYAPAYGWIAAGSAVVAALLIGSLLGALRRDEFASWIAGRAGRMATRLRSSIDPDAWVAWVLEFRGHVVRRASGGLPITLAALVVMVVVDGVLVGLCVRFVGVSAQDVPLLAIVGLFLPFYPLTLFPFAGLGMLERGPAGRDGGHRRSGHRTRRGGRARRLPRHHTSRASAALRPARPLHLATYECPSSEPQPVRGSR